MGLSQAMLRAIRECGFEQPSPIQAEFIPIAMTGEDCIGQARTGTGKTAAFVVPILETIDFASPRPQALVLTPTRELCEQVAQEARRLSVAHPCKVACIVGGKSIRAQVDALRAGSQLVVGTPGRIIDLLNRGSLQIDALEIVVLDEADRMLDIGFRPDIEKILRRCPEERQTLLLSATLPPPVEKLAQRYMREPRMVDLSKDEIGATQVEQYYLTVDPDRKFGALVRLLARERPQQALVFTRTKRTADHLYEKIVRRLPEVACLHGDLPQPRRDSVMRRFRSGEIRLLIATDIVGRGIDVSGISHIINYDIPEFCDDYVHRIGRTGRMSSDSPGTAYTFVCRDQGDELTRVEGRINKLLTQYIIEGYATVSDGPPPKKPRPPGGGNFNRRPRR